MTEASRQCNGGAIGGRAAGAVSAVIEHIVRCNAARSVAGHATGSAVIGQTVGCNAARSVGRQPARWLRGLGPRETARPACDLRAAAPSINRARHLTAECPCECPLPEISFPGRRRETRSVLIVIRDLSESGSKNPLQAESARGPGLWATEESWEPREGIMSVLRRGSSGRPVVHRPSSCSAARSARGGSPPERCD